MREGELLEGRAVWNSDPSYVHGKGFIACRLSEFPWLLHAPPTIAFGSVLRSIRTVNIDYFSKPPKSIGNFHGDAFGLLQSEVRNHIQKVLAQRWELRYQRMK